jgi:hypothetical protein
LQSDASSVTSGTQMETAASTAPAPTAATRPDGPVPVDPPTPEAEGEPSSVRPGRPSLRHWYLLWPAIVYVAARGLTLLGLTVANVFIHHDSLWNELYRWDGKWFVHAATQGYPNPLPMVHGHVGASTIAFFPVFPLLIRGLSDVTTLEPVIAAGIISAITGLTATLSVGMLTRQFAGEEKATRAALLFAVFPGTFAFSLMYSEGIAITCVALGLVALLRGRWWLAGLLGLVATATTPIALAFVVSCAWCAGRAILRDRTWRSLVAPVLAPLGFIAYMLYLWVHTGQLNAWRLTERGGWKSYPSLGYPIHIVTTFLGDPIRPTVTGQILFVGTVIVVVACVVAIRQRQPGAVLIYGLLAAAIAAVSAPVGLRPRFIMLAFPLISAVATRLRGRPYAWVVALSLVGLVAMTYLELFSGAVFP